MKTRTIHPMGHLQAGETKRWIAISLIEKVSENLFAFEVVETGLFVGHTEDDYPIYPEPYRVEIKGDWFLEYDITKPIRVQVPDEDEINLLLKATDRR